MNVATRGRIQHLPPHAWCIRWDWDNAITGEKFKLEIMWGHVSGYFGVTITCASCIEILSKVWYIPKPLEVNFCVGGQISIQLNPMCGLPLVFSGKVYWSIDGSIDLVIYSFTVAKLEVGISGTAPVHYQTNCRWVHDARRRRRRRWWDRRRHKRVCDSTCDVKLSGYVRLQFLMGRGILEESYYL